MSDVLDRLKSALADRYAIERELGAGGMATVYLAKDLKHERRVAVKVLRPELAATVGPERFLREIRIAANLTHPHILPLHDSGEADGFLFYVMPYIEGESLRDRLAREGELPVNEAVRILRDVVDALAYAHEQGLVHRDIKPDNVLLSGRHALVTDFGVAKALSEAAGRQTLTTAGVALGTPAYMAPEQAAAEPQIDHRADIYALGALAYELLAGKPPFRGETSRMVLSAHVMEAPEPVTNHRPAVPAPLGELVMKCLEKKPADRWQSAEEMLQQLEAVVTPSGGVTPTSTRAVSVSTWLRRWPVMAGAIVIVAAAAVVLWQQLRGGAGPADRGENPPGQLVAPVQVTANPIEFSVTGAGISRDGKLLAFVDLRGLHVQVLATGETRRLEIDEPMSPWKVSWYPDGTQLLLLATDAAGTLSLWSISIWGGRPLRIQDSITEAEVSPDGSFIAAVRGGNTRDKSLREIWLMGPNGEDPRLLVAAVPEESFWRLAWAPDSRHLAFGNWKRPGSLAIETIAVDGSERKVLLSDDELLQWWTGILPFTWCANGRFILALREGPGHQATSNIWVVQTDPATRETVGDMRRVTQLAGSNVRGLGATADCTTLMALLVRNQADVFVAELDATGTRLFDETQLTLDQREDFPTGWTADGQSVLFMSSRGGSLHVYRTDIEAEGPEPIHLTPGEEESAVHSPDGAWLLHIIGGDIRRVPSGGGAAATVLEGEYWQIRCLPSGDGRCVAGHVDGDDYVLSSFDPVRGEPEELVRIAHRAPFTYWDISPDGYKVAVVHNDDDVIRLVSLASGQETELKVQGWTSFEYVSWAADGQGLFVNAGFATAGVYPVLLRVELDGRVHVLRQRPNEWHVFPVASPDGRYLAFASMPFHGNVWLIDGF